MRTHPALPGPADGETRLRTFALRNLDQLVERYGLDDDTAHTIRVVGRVLPFKTNAYVCDELIDWARIPDDPMFQLTFPQRGMLDRFDYDEIDALVRGGADEDTIQAAARGIQERLNPHPSAQMHLNVPRLNGRPVPGMQHKYRDTVLFFPSQGQTCHAYCTYCFRWAQFVGTDELRFAANEVEPLLGYLRANPTVTEVLFTGGDPMVMRTPVLRRYVEPLLAPEFAHVTIRIGTKSLAYWPHRFLAGDDADDALRLFEEVEAAGRHLAFMAHFTHPRELQTDAVREAMRRILATGAAIRTQAPLIAHVNDEAAVWADMWKTQVRLGAMPYYMFVERDTGARHYFEVPLTRALDIYTRAFQMVPGLARTARGPVMSATPGKVLVDGIATVGNEPVLVCKMLQARDPARANGIFFARFDECATWFDQLEPAPGSDASWFPHFTPEPPAPSGRSFPVGSLG